MKSREEIAKTLAPILIDLLGEDCGWVLIYSKQMGVDVMSNVNNKDVVMQLLGKISTHPSTSHAEVVQVGVTN